MNIKLTIKGLLVFALISCFCSLIAMGTEVNKDRAPEASPGQDELEFRDIPVMEKGFWDTTPDRRDDGVPVGELGVDGGKKAGIVELAQQISDGKHGPFDSLLIAHKGKLLFESYYVRGRINLPHPQASATKTYTGLLLGRAIQLGYLTMEDLDSPLISFFKDLDPSKFAKGAENITLNHALSMSSGIRLTEEQQAELEDLAGELKGSMRLQAVLERTAPITPESQTFKYGWGASLAMQVINAVVPGGAADFLKHELLDKLAITNYKWSTAPSGLPEAGWLTDFTSRDMLKFGMLIDNKGKWKGEQLIPEAFVSKAVSRILYTGDDDIYGGGKDVSKAGYGYLMWTADLKSGDQTYLATSAQGGGSQYIIMVDELDLVIVVTAHSHDIKTLQITAEQIIPAFVR